MRVFPGRRAPATPASRGGRRTPSCSPRSRLCRYVPDPGGGDGGYVAPEAGLEPAPPPTEGLETASVSLATEDSLGNGRQPGEPQGLSREKPLETCGARSWGLT